MKKWLGFIAAASATAAAIFLIAGFAVGSMTEPGSQFEEVTGIESAQGN